VFPCGGLRSIRSRSELLQGVAFACALVAVAATARAAPPTIAQLGADVGLDEGAIRRVEAGRVVEAVPKETSDRDLAVGLVFTLKASPKELARGFLRGGDFAANANVVASRRIAAAADFDALRLAPRGADEAKRYLAAQPGETLNLSDAEAA